MLAELRRAFPSRLWTTPPRKLTLTQEAQQGGSSADVSCSVVIYLYVTHRCSACDCRLGNAGCNITGWDVARTTTCLNVRTYMERRSTPLMQIHLILNSKTLRKHQEDYCFILQLQMVSKVFHFIFTHSVRKQQIFMFQKLEPAY